LNEDEVETDEEDDETRRDTATAGRREATT